MSKQIMIATTQLDASPAPLAERLSRAEALVTQAAQTGAQLIVLPELFNTGYAYRTENFSSVETIDGPTATWMRQTSAKLSVHLAGSLFLQDNGEIYNALMLFSPDGRNWRYDKNYPWGWERAYFRERRAVTIAETELGSIGLMLCWDMAHPDLWRQYAGKVDLMLACSCPPNIPDPTYHFPTGETVTTDQLGPVFKRLRQSAGQVFIDTPIQQTSWLGVPFVSSTACGSIRTPIPNPVGSFLGILSNAPWLIRYLGEIKQVEVSADLVEAAHIFSADGTQLAELNHQQGETFALAQVTIPPERPKPQGPQPKPRVSWMVYFISDYFLTTVSAQVYSNQLRRMKTHQSTSRTNPESIIE